MPSFLFFHRNTSLSLPDGFTGFERILLTANGNLQRLIR